MTNQRYEITFDGGSINNPGKGYGSYRITGPDGVREVVRLDYSPNGEVVTNNQAEYRTLIAALEETRNLASPEADQTMVRVFGDSSLVINQVSGKWKVKHPDLKPLHETAQSLVKTFQKVDLIWRGRDWAVDILGH